MTQDEDGVTIKAVHNPKSGEPKEKIFRVKYLVGCDGGSSWVRKQLDSQTAWNPCLACLLSQERSA